MASSSGIQGHSIELNVVGCTNLHDTEWLTKQDPYVCLEYAGVKMTTRVCKDGSTNPTFQDKFTINLINGYTVIDVAVWNHHRIRPDEFISGGKASLQKAITEGFDDSSRLLQTRNGRHGGEVRFIMHYKNPVKIEAGPSCVAPSGGNLHTATSSDKPSLLEKEGLET